MSKTLILIRHAHRDNSQRELDNGLTDKGREQVKNLHRFFSGRFAEEHFEGGLWFVSSPKRRCLETLSPLAKVAGAAVDTHPDLDEQAARESDMAFVARVERFLHEWQQAQPEWTFLCSHGDWLPVAADRLLGLRHEFKKGSWFEIEGPLLRWYVPSFKALY
jgi:broad specificity phosphatase PhoE